MNKQKKYFMQDEEIIRQEAVDFYRSKIHFGAGKDLTETVAALKQRLLDFYTPGYKAIFLDQIEKEVAAGLQKHRDERHNGNPGVNCTYEKMPVKLLFYIKQELGTLPIVAHQKNKNINSKERNKVFVSYSHADKDFLVDIQRHFKPFLKDIDFWDDSKIMPGQKWKDEIKDAISQSKVAILLVSADFLGSDFISTDELPPLLEAAEKEGAVILTLIVRPCLFEEFDSLNQYQAMNPPSRPVVKMDATEKEEIYVNLVRQTKRILSGK